MAAKADVGENYGRGVVARMLRGLHLSFCSWHASNSLWHRSSWLLPSCTSVKLKATSALVAQCNGWAAVAGWPRITQC